MYQPHSFNGADLPAKTLCLTFDDGPGVHTLNIARFLFEHQIRATFFVVGKYAYHHPEILLELDKMNHIIGNHTYEHPDLPYYVSADGNVLDQVLRTDVLIKPFVGKKPVYFRAPYGKWSAEVAHELNQSILTFNHIGPIHWEVSGVDCYYWQNNWPVADAAERYLNDIALQGRGIVVMHDEIADMDVVKPRNQTLELLQVLIPKLLGLDYKFVSLDEVPSVKKVANEKSVFTLHDKHSCYLSLKENSEISVTGKPDNPKNLLQLEDLGYGKVAIKTANNLYLSTSNPDLVKADKSIISETETFDLIPVNASSIMLRCTSGNYLKVKDKKLAADVQFMRQATIFKFANHNSTIKNKLSFKQKILLKKKQLQFIKSKLQQQI